MTRFLGFLRRNALPLILALVLAFPALQWGIWDATWLGREPEQCLREPTAEERRDLDEKGALPASGLLRREGACWPVVWANAGQLLAGRIPPGERWRASASLVVFAAALALAWRLRASRMGRAGVSLAVGFVLAAFLLRGGWGILPPLESGDLGGLALTVWLTVVGALGGLVLGTGAALLRRAKLPLLSPLAVGYVEIVRGVPLVTLLFFGQYVFPLFFPAGTERIPPVLRAQVVIILFAGAYLSEVVRAGLQAVPRGQTEAALALGLGPVRSLRFVVLPQALRASLPALVGTLVGLFKDTSLVAIIGLFDFLGTARAIPSNPRWIGWDVELLVFAGLVYWALAYFGSRLAPTQPLFGRTPA